MQRYVSFTDSTAVNNTSLPTNEIFEITNQWPWEPSDPVETTPTIGLVDEHKPQKIKLKLIDDKLLRLVEKEPVPDNIESIDATSFVNLLEKIK